MIVDLTKQFKSNFQLFLKQNYNNFDSNKKQNYQNKQNFIHNVPFQYQLDMKYAQDVYLSLQRIQQILIEKKDNYFSNAAYSLNSFTNQQRNQFDQQTKQAFKICSDQIDQLSQLSSRLASSSNSKINQTYIANLKEIILCLHQYFKNLQKQFTQFLKYNEIKKRKILNTLSIQPVKTERKDLKYFQKRKQNLQNINMDNSKVQLEKEAHLFYVQKVEQQKKTIQTKQAIQNISQILEQMSKKVLDQQLLTSSFQQIGSVGLSFIQQGNRNLVQANTLSKQSGKYWIILFMSMALSLLIIDFLKS